MIYITHNLGVDKQPGERIYVMKLGEVVEQVIGTVVVRFIPIAPYDTAV